MKKQAIERQKAPEVTSVGKNTRHYIGIPVVMNLHELHAFMVKSLILSKKVKTHGSTKMQYFFFVFSRERCERVVEKNSYFLTDVQGQGTSGLPGCFFAASCWQTR